MPAAERVSAVGRLSDICRTELLDGSREQMASRIHEHYRQAALQGGADATEPRFQSWSKLNETWRNASRRAGDHVPVKLESARYMLTQHNKPDRGNPISALDEEGLFQLAKVEHTSWCIERVLQGWRCGPRNNARKTHDNLVPFEALSEEVKRKDFDQLRLLASMKDLE